jgi:hypothetical protein
LVAGWIFVGLVIFAPLNFGSTRAGGPEILTGGCVLGTVVWALSFAAGGPRPQLPWAMVASVLLLAVAALPWCRPRP